MSGCISWTRSTYAARSCSYDIPSCDAHGDIVRYRHSPDDVDDDVDAGGGEDRTRRRIRFSLARRDPMALVIRVLMLYHAERVARGHACSPLERAGGERLLWRRNRKKSAQNYLSPIPSSPPSSACRMCFFLSGVDFNSFADACFGISTLHSDDSPFGGNQMTSPSHHHRHLGCRNHYIIII